MILNEIKKSRGQVAKIILALAIIVVIALIIAFFVTRKTAKAPVKNPGPATPPPPVYNTKVHDINFVLLDNVDMGDILSGKESRKPKSQPDIKTTERFIEVTVGAQNTTKINTIRNSWDIGNIIDDQGRNFIPKSTATIANWLPADSVNNCGKVLEPIFTPTPCIKIYDVAKGSTGLKIQVWVEKSKTDSTHVTGLLDLRPMY